MRDFKDKVAVVTGGASGIGLAMAQRFAREGMRVVIADIETEALAAAEREVRSMGSTVLAVRTDVSKSQDVEALAASALNAFGSVHIVCNNAGVAGTSGPLWERSIGDWQWVMGVNVWGVIHGIHTFVPIMLKQGEDAHVVNTASVAGLISRPFGGIYHATKHAIVTISEVLHAELALAGAPIGVSVLCPGFVKTRIKDSSRNRPAELTEGIVSPAAQAIRERVSSMVDAGISPDSVADKVLDAVREEKLYILTHSEFNEPIRQRVEGILEGRNPVLELPPPNSVSISRSA
ncbi:MAG TPA: SDR family NAD(P)-dependent oxidoreductase [Candidatus Acidoferrales bacterium]|nr:SDR family NAD(P)-dependent oxidoreductase [Candidatus Acidoferrales bacterium]